MQIKKNSVKEFNGYIYIRVGTQWLPEHRLVTEEVLGRQLSNAETVHHINFCRSDNRKDNLALFENQRSHMRFHLQLIQFGYTRPLIREIESRKILNIKSSLNNCNTDLNSSIILNKQ
jgi:hypothetical protein